jgi:hypothetical protein
MPSYSISAPDGNTYTITGPEGASREEVIQEVLSQNPSAGTAKTFGGYAKETLKALPRGLIGGVETAVTGAAALLPEEYEKPVVAKAQELAKRFSPQAAPGYEDSVPVKIGEGLGSMGSFLVPGGLPARALMASAMGAGEARQRVQQEGATPEQISSATAQGILPGLTDLLPIQFLLGGVGKVALTGLVSRGVRAAATGSVEALQEASQNILQNAIAQGYNPEQGLYEGTGEAASYGGAVGAIAQGLMDLALPGRARRGQQPQREAAATPVAQEAPITPEVQAPFTPEVQAPITPEVQEPAAPTPETPLAPEAPQAEPVKAAEAAAPAAVAPEVKPGVITDSVIKDLGVKGYGSTKVKDTLRGVDLNTVEGQKIFDDTFTSAHKNLKYNADAVQAFRASVPNLYEAPSNELNTIVAPPSGKPIQAEGVGSGGDRTSDGEPVSPKKSRKSSTAKPVVAGMGGTKQPAGGPVGGEEVLPNALTGSAFRAKDGAVYPTGAIHDLNKLPDEVRGNFKDLEAGFVDSTGKFYTRDEAADHQLAQDKITPEQHDVYTSGEPIAALHAEEVFGKDAADAARVEGRQIAAKKRLLAAGVPESGVDGLAKKLSEMPPVAANDAIKKIGEKRQRDAKAAGNEGTPDPKRLKRAAEYEQMKDAPKAAKDYYDHYGSIDESLKNLGFDLAEKTKKGEMGYVKEGGAPALQFSDWIGKTGTTEQKATLKNNQDEYAKIKAKAEDAVFVQRGVKQRDLEEAVREQLEREKRLAAETEFKQRKREKVGETETEAEANKAEEAAAKIGKTAEGILAERAARKSKGETPAKVETKADIERVIKEASENEPEFSRGEAAAPTGNTKEGVTKALKNHFKEDSRFDALTTVVQSERDLPEEIRKSKDYQAGTKGVAYKGKVFLVADNIQPGRELGVFLHEAGAHIGFDSVMKPSDRQFLADQVRKWAKGNNDLVETKAAKAALEKGGKSNDEIIAYMTEELVNRGVKPTSFRPANTWLRRVMEAFKKVMTKLGLRQDITPQELVDFANGAAHIAMKAPGKAVKGAPRFSQANPAMDAIDTRTLGLASGPSAPQSIVQRAYQTALNPRPEKFMQNLRQDFANKNTWWEDWFSSLHGNNALDTAGAASAIDRVQASTKTGGIQLSTLEKGGFRKGANGLWEAYDTDASYKDIVEQVSKMEGKYNATPDFDSAQTMFNLAATAKREEGLIQSGQIGPGKIKRTLNDTQLQQGLAVFNSTPEIQEALRLYKKFNDRNVDTLITAGIIDSSLAAELKGNSGYVPWFRFMQDANGDINVKAVKDFSRGLINLSKMQDLEGGKIEDIQIGNILDNMAKLSNWMVGKSIGNDTSAFMVDFAIPYGQAKRVGSPIAGGVDPKKTIQIMRNGIPTYYEMSDPAALPAFKGYEAAHGAIVSVLAKPANILRKAITLNPIFSLAQLPQDSFRAFAASGLKNPYAIFPRVMKNFIKELGSTDTGRELAKYGIVGKGSGMPTEASDNIRRQLGYYDKGTGGVWARLSDTLEKISSASDAAVRTALYELTLEEGGSQVLALRRAREIINFDTQGAGATSSFLRQTVPFMGVWMNDLNNLYKGLVLGSARLSEGEKNATRAAIVYRGMQLAGLVTLYTLMVGDDDDYKKLDDDTRNRSLIVPGTGFRIPIPNDGIGFLFKVIPEEVTRAVMAQGIESDDAGAKMGRALWNGFKNIGSFENLLPGAGSPLIKTPVELILNKSFYTGNPIVGKSKEFLAPAEQYTEGTSEIAKQLGAALNLSPIKLDYLVRGLTAQVGGSVLAASNSLFHAADGKVTPSWSGDIKDIPLLGQLGYSRKDKGDLEDYYELRDTVDKVSRTYRDMIASGRGKEAIEYITDPTNQKAFALRQLQTQIDKGLAQYRNMEKLIYNNQNLDSNEMRRQLDRVDEMRTKYLQSLRLPKIRAFAEISPNLDSSAFRILR